jgi:hypothetical protein
MVEYIKIDDMLASIVIRNEYTVNGIEFFTEPTDSLQVGQMARPKGYIIAPHIHKPVSRNILYTNEVLLVKKGKVKVIFYNMDCIYHSSTLLNAGDVILLANGGHGFEMLEDSEIVEVKQGPYAGESDKLRF